MHMENGNKINYTYHIFKLIKQFDINLYQYLLEYYKINDGTRLSKYLFGQYKDKYEDPILEIVKHTHVWSTNKELQNITYLFTHKWNIFLFETGICYCRYDYDQLLKLNKKFWEDNILLQYIKEYNVR